MIGLSEDPGLAGARPGGWLDGEALVGWPFAVPALLGGG